MREIKKIELINHIRKKGWILLGFSAILCSLAMCDSMAVTAKVKATPCFKQYSVVIYRGATKQLKLRRAKGPITWKSSKKSVVTVSKKGKITGKRAGKAYITAKCRNGKKKCRVTVKKGTFRLNYKSVTTNLSKSFVLRGKFQGIKDKKLRFQSSKPSVASVDQKGRVRTRQAGKTVITVTSSTNIRKKCKVVVKKGYTLSFAKDNISLEVGEKCSNPVKKSSPYTDLIQYSSSDPAVAEVDQRGNVTAKQPGDVKITAKGSQDTKSYRIHVPEIIWSDATHFIAHRGYAEFEQENTMPAFRAAIDVGFWGIETDIYMTRDGVFVLSHDACLWGKNYGMPEALEDETERNGMIADLTYEQLVRLTGGRIVTVEEFLQLLQGKQEIPLLELKQVVSSQYPSEQEAVAFCGADDTRPMEEKRIACSIHALLELVGKYNRLDACYITSFHTALIEEVRRQNPTIKIQYITMEKTIDLDYLCSHQFGLDWYLPCANEADMKRLQSRGVNVCLWTADNRLQIDKALKLGADAITTDTLFFRYRK